jgi:hypothetical protein
MVGVQMVHFLGDMEACYALACQLAGAIANSYPSGSDDGAKCPVYSDEPLHQARLIVLDLHVQRAQASKATVASTWACFVRVHHLDVHIVRCSIRIGRKVMDTRRRTKGQHVQMLVALGQEEHLATDLRSFVFQYCVANAGVEATLARLPRRLHLAAVREGHCTPATVTRPAFVNLHRCDEAAAVARLAVRTRLHPARSQLCLQCFIFHTLLNCAGCAVVVRCARLHWSQHTQRLGVRTDCISQRWQG